VYELLQAAARGHIGLDQRFMRSIIGRGDAAVDDLLRFGLEDHDLDRVDLEQDLIVLFRYFKSPRSLPYLIDCVRTEPEDIPDDVVEAIMPFAAGAVEPLLEIYRNLEEEEAGDVAFLLASLNVRDRRILDALLERLEYAADDGAFCLGMYGDPAAKPALERIAAEIPEEDADLRREVEHAIELIDSAVGAEHEAVEHSAPDIAELYPDEAPPVFEVLDTAEVLDMLATGSPAVRVSAAESFANRSITEAAGQALFGYAQSDTDPAVRGACWEVLAETEDKAIKTAMRNVLRDETRDVRERCGALVGLADDSGKAEINTAIRAFYEDPKTRAKAMEAMWRSFDRQYADIFPKHLDDTDPDLKRQAVWGVGYLGLGTEAGRLAKMLEDADLRQDALFAYALSVPAEVSRGRIMGLLRKIDKVAAGLTPGEADLVKIALDQRLSMHGLEPVFSEIEDDEDEDEVPAEAAPPPTVITAGRNDPCPCGSGKKFKKCHGA
jgi:HEAT repeat protein